MSSESKALVRLKATEKIISENKKMKVTDLEALLFYTYGVLPRTTAKYIDCLVNLKKIDLEYKGDKSDKKKPVEWFVVSKVEKEN